MNRELLQQVRETLPPALNAGILMADRGTCILGWMLLMAGFHPITIYNSTVAVIDPTVGGPAVDVVARAYGLEPAQVRELGEINDSTEPAKRTEAVRAELDAIINGERDG
jgi:hypothetical protein